MSKKKTHEEYVAEVAAINPNIEVVGEYKKSYISIEHKCKKCGNVWFPIPNNILKGTNCPKCTPFPKKRKTHEQYVAEVLSINSDIDVIERYNGSLTPIRHKCKICGNIWSVRPNSILLGTGCPVCSGCIKKTHEQYVKELKSVNPNIVVVGEYVNNATKIMHKCIKDGYEWLLSPSNALKGKGCPRCNTPTSSKGEKIISDFLNKYNILYEPQKTFDGCKDKVALRFDFYLSEYNILIEYNGIQHYKPIDYFGGEDSFECGVYHDKIKADYCAKNNITLITIPYYADIHEELDKLYELITTRDMTKEAAA